jgi:hypothetical protein
LQRQIEAEKQASVEREEEPKGQEELQQHEFVDEFADNDLQNMQMDSQRYVGAEIGGDLVEGVDFSQTPRMNVDATH